MTRYLAAAMILLAADLPFSHAQSPGSLKPTNLDKVNTSADEDDPFVAADGNILYYASNKGGKFEILIAQRTAKGWSPGHPYTAVNSKGVDTRSPFVARDLKFYYATNWIPDPKFKDLQNFDLKVKSGTRAALMLPGVSEVADELHPWVTASGKEFYFSRKLKEGWRLFVARGPALGPIGDAEPVGFPAGFHHATVSATGLTMYLQGPLEKGRWGLFVSTRGKVGAPWSKPAPLTALNHPEGPRGDLSPCLSGDGLRLYFASDRPGGKGGLDLWGIPTAQLNGKAK